MANHNKTMAAPPICSYCKVHQSIVSCRDCQARGICFPCVISVPTGGQCKVCFTKFVSIHLKFHLKELKDSAWLSAYMAMELESIDRVSKNMKELDKKKESEEEERSLLLLFDRF